MTSHATGHAGKVSPRPRPGSAEHSRVRRGRRPAKRYRVRHAGGIPAAGASPVADEQLDDLRPPTDDAEDPEPDKDDQQRTGHKHTEPAAGPTIVTFPNGETLTAASPQLAAAIEAAAGGTPIAEAFRQQGMTIPAPGTAVSDPVDPSQWSRRHRDVHRPARPWRSVREPGAGQRPNPAHRLRGRPRLSRLGAPADACNGTAPEAANAPTPTRPATAERPQTRRGAGPPASQKETADGRPIHVVPANLREAAARHQETSDYLRTVPASHAAMQGSLDSLGPIFGDLSDAGRELLELRRQCYEQQADDHADLADKLTVSASCGNSTSRKLRGNSGHR